MMIIVTLLFLGYRKEDGVDNKVDHYTGHYEIISCRSNISVDLDANGKSSQELTGEINSFVFRDL